MQSASPSLETWISQRGFDALPIPAYIYTPDGTVIAGNRTAEELWRTPTSVLVDSKYNIVANVEALGAALIAEFQASVTEGQSRSGEPILIRLEPSDSRPIGQDGCFWTQSYFIPFKDDDGVVHYVMGMGLDVTREMVRLEQIRDAEREMGAQRETIARLELAQREIERQRETILKLSSPIIDVWRGIVLVPMVGEIDSEDVQVISERLLAGITARQSRVAILDLTGASHLDAQSADALMRIHAMVRLLGTECLLAGIQPAVAKTLIELGVELGDVKVFGNLSDALARCMHR